MSPLLAALAGLLVTVASSGAQTPIPDAPSCAACTIEVRVDMRLGSEDGPGALPLPAGSVVVDSRGRYWLFFFSTPPLIFAADGRFLQEAGRSGDGPGEFRYPRTGFAVGDSVVVFDNTRATVFGPELELVRSIRLPTDTRKIAALRWPAAVLFHGRFGSTREASWPLHLARMSGSDTELVRSFGAPDETQPPEPRDPFDHVFATPVGGSVWSAEQHRYRITRLDDAGRAIASFMRMPSWFSGVSSSSPGGPGTPPSPAIDAITTDAAGLVWVFSRVARSTWRDAWVAARARAATPPGLSESSQGVPGNRALYHTMIEVIDPAAARVVARRTIDDPVLGTVGPGRVISWRETSNGAPIVELLTVELRGRPGR